MEEASINPYKRWANLENGRPRIVNLTNHTIKELISGMEFSPDEAGVARVDVFENKEYEDISGFTITRTKYKSIVGIDIENLDPDTLYIVSAVVLNALQERGITKFNVVAPKGIIRDNNGNVIGARGFRTNG